jgi:ABC-type lipoprotein release transport system permease subunit
LTHVTLGVLTGGALIALMAFAVAGGDGGLGRVEGGLSVANVALLLAYAALMLGVCLLACIVPTWRALNVEPTVALRAD